jgi:hypothetical protein
MLSPEEEARNFDRQRDKRAGNDSGLTPKQLKQLEKQKKEEQEKYKTNAENGYLEKFTGFNNDPLGYLHSIVSQGEFSNRDQRTQLYNLITFIKIEQDLNELILVLKSRK